MKQKNFIKIRAAVQRGRAAVQRGVTLIELTIVLIIIGIIIAVLYTQIGGGTDTALLRSANMIRHAKLVVLAAQGQQQTLGCFATTTGGLFTSALLDANNSCGVAVADFNGPYIRGVSFNSAATPPNILLDDVISGARGNIATTAATGTGTNVWYRVSPLAENLAQAIYTGCSGASATPVGAAAANLGAPCIYTAESGSGVGDAVIGLLIGNY